MNADSGCCRLHVWYTNMSSRRGFPARLAAAISASWRVVCIIYIYTRRCTFVCARAYVCEVHRRGGRQGVGERAGGNGSRRWLPGERVRV
jgi:hypothetical protein